MRSLNKKGVGITSETLVTIIILTVTLVIIVGLIFMVRSSMPADEWDSYVCWITNEIRGSNLAFRHLLPSSCLLVQVKNPVGKEEISRYLVNAWWMYGKGENDFGDVGDNFYAVYSFSVNEKIDRNALYEYLLSHASGKSVDVEHSDYNYIQKGSKGPTLCYEDGTKAVLETGKTYFVMFLDDQTPKDKGDKLVLSSTLKEGKIASRTGYSCYSAVGNKLEKDTL